MRLRVLSLFVPLSLLLFLLLPACVFAVPTFDQAVDKLVAKGYPQAVETDLTSFGTSPQLGFAMAGSTADDQAAEYIAGQLRASGFVNVHLEPVPVDEWGFRGASVQFPGPGGTITTLQASTFGGVSPTPTEGISAPVVYVGAGTAAAFDAAPSVVGKIVLIDALLGSWWMDWPFREAEIRGAVAIIYRSVATDLSYYGEPNALGSMDAEYNYPGLPVVHISRVSGQQFYDALMAGPVTATIHNDVDVRLAADGGTGYNVYAEYPGGDPNGETVLFMAHHDFYFRAGLDDNGAVACALTVAKALRQSGYRPHGKLAFLFTTGEEFGRINSYYDWLIGSWWAITQEHPDWPGKLAGVVNYELMAQTGTPVLVRINPELQTLVKNTAAADPTVVPYGYTLGAPYCWNDQFPFTAAGVPSIYFRARNAEMAWKYYHTNYDTVALQDWHYLGQLAKFSKLLAERLDKGLLPYDLTGRANELAASVSNGAALLSAGAQVSVLARLNANIAAFQTEAQAFKDDAASIPSSQVPAVNKALMAIEVDLNKAFTALDAWDITIYPHQQVLYDIQKLDLTLAALKTSPVEKATALLNLKKVGITKYGPAFSYDNYLRGLARHQPDFPGLYWGAMGHLAPYLNVMPAYRQIEADNLAPAITDLEGKRAAEAYELNVRLNQMADVVEGVIPEIQALH